MQAHHPSRISHPSHLPNLGSVRKNRAGRVSTHLGEGKRAGMNPWVVICVLAIAGWSLDSMLVSIELHQLEGGDFRAHLSHFWYGPLILLALLLLVRKALPRAALWGPRLTAGSIARCGRRSGVKRLADRLAAGPLEDKVLGVLLRYPSTAMTAHDLAGHAAQTEGDTEQALTDLVDLGLAEELELAGTRFYRLTRNSQRCEELRELEAWHAWHRAWQTEADRIFDLAGPESGEAGR